MALSEKYAFKIKSFQKSRSNIFFTSHYLILEIGGRERSMKSMISSGNWKIEQRTENTEQRTLNREH